VGLCKGGTQTCNAEGTAFGACEGAVLPQPETCATPDDDDCDGLINEEGQGCVCVPGATAPCYTGPVGTVGVGACKAGLQTCLGDGTGYGACVGDVVPSPEVCAGGSTVDEDCDGQVNEDGDGCACAPGSFQPCYEGPAGTENVGLCVGGIQQCLADGTGYGACEGAVLPQPETCAFGQQVDEDCDGQVNEGGEGCVCVPGSVAPCYSGPGGTQNVGICKGGSQTCSQDGAGYGSCLGEVLPQVESCATAGDDDCNGQALTCAAANQDCNPQTGQCEDACSPTLLGNSYVGCEYYPTVTANVVSATFSFAVAISNTSAKPASVTITRGAQTISTVTVAANSVQIVNLPWVNELKGGGDTSSFPTSVLLAQGAYKLLSSRPVTVYQYSPLAYAGGGTNSFTNDASLLLPVNAWKNSYRVASRAHWQFSSGSFFSGFSAIVAREDNTQVTIAAGPQGGNVKGGIAGLDAKGNGTVTLNAGGVLQLQQARAGDRRPPVHVHPGQRGVLRSPGREHVPGGDAGDRVHRHVAAHPGEHAQGPVRACRGHAAKHHALV
jgi:hypothetical protein